jgi:hypothetical protein
MPRNENEPALEGMLAVARYHREHERFHSMNGLQQAAELRRESNALKVLAERWFQAAEAPPSSIDYSDPRFQAAGCEDLNDRAAIATTGILFMEGESEPRELLQLKMKLMGVAEGLARTSLWLGEKMEAGWERESVLLTPELATAARPRFMALKHTTLAGVKFGVVARLLRAALAALSSQELVPSAVRKDLKGMAQLVLTASWLLDEAAGLLAEQATDVARSDPEWTTYMAELEGLRARAVAASPDQSGAEAPEATAES